MEEHGNDCDEDLSSLAGKDQPLDTLRTDTLDEESAQLMHLEYDYDMCSGIEQFMLYGVVAWPADMQTLKQQA